MTTETMRTLVRSILAVVVLASFIQWQGAVRAATTSLELNQGEHATITCGGSRFRYSRSSQDQLSARCYGQPSTTPGLIWAPAESQAEDPKNDSASIELAAGDELGVTCSATRLSVRFDGKLRLTAWCMGRPQASRTPEPTHSPRPKFTDL